MKLSPSILGVKSPYFWFNTHMVVTTNPVISVFFHGNFQVGFVFKTHFRVDIGLIQIWYASLATKQKNTNAYPLEV